MDGASKFVRGDAIAGLIILAVNIFGGIVIGVTRHSLTLGAAADVFTKLSVGDGLVTQIPALIISLAAGLLVAKGGTRGSADKAVIDQLSGYPNALFLAALAMAVLGVVPGLPFLPFALIGGLMAFVGIAIPRRIEKDRLAEAAKVAASEERTKAEARASIKEQLKSFEIELVLSKELNAALLPSRDEIGSRIAKMRRKFARQYGFVVPEIRLSDDIRAAPRTYQIKFTAPQSRPGITGYGPSHRHRRRTASQSAGRRSARARLWHSRDRDPRGIRQGREARGLQAGRSGLGAAHPFERGHPQ